MSPKTSIFFTFMIPVLALALIVVRLEPVRAENEPTISLVKTIEIREYKGYKVGTDTYVVKPGDSLAKILFDRGVTGTRDIPGEFVRMAQAFNPELKNPDLIYPGMNLILPTGPVQGLTPETGPPADRPKEETASTEPGPKPEPKPEPVEPPKEEPAPKPAPEEAGYKTVTVQPGDSLGALLRRAGVPHHLIFNQVINLTLKANPELQNPNLIYAGQQIKVPVQSSWADTTVAGLEEEKSGPSRPVVPPTATKITTPGQDEPDKKPSKALIPPPPVPPSEHLAARTALGLVFTRIGERFLSKGQHFLPLKTGGQITINTNSFPIIELRTGHRIILDLDMRLPKEMVRLIRINWSNYIIFRPKAREGLPQMLGRLFELGQYHKVYKRGESWQLNRGVTIRIGADWIIWPTEEDWTAGRAVVITLPGNPKLGTSPVVASYLADQGIKVIDFHPRGNLIGPETGGGAQTAADVNFEEMRPHDCNELLEELLDMVNQKYETDLTIPLMGGSKDGTEFSFSVHAPIYFTRQGVNYVVALEELSAEMNNLLKKQRFKVIIREDGESGQEMARKMLKAMGVRTEDGLTVKASNRRDDRNIEINMPGLIIHSGNGRIFLTDGAIPRRLAPLLEKPGLRVVKYRMLETTVGSAPTSG